jgi:hypothetical protein
VYEDLEAIAQLKFGKEMNNIAEQMRQSVQETTARFAASTGAGIRSGHHDAALGRIRIAAVEQMAQSYFHIWVDLIRLHNGHIARGDIAFIAGKIEQLANAQKRNLNQVFAQQGGVVVPTLAEEAGRRMYAVSANARRDLEIMVREHEASPKRISAEKAAMNKVPSRYSVGRRVLFGMANRPGVVKSADNLPGQMGEFVHEIQDDKTQEVVKVLGCDIRPFPELDEDLRYMNRPTIHIENSNVANLNFGSQIGTINAALQHISEGDQSQQEFAHALEEFTQAVVFAKLADDDKKEVVEALSTIAEQAAKKPEERSKGNLKAVVAWIPHAVSTAAHLTALWDKFGPIIKAHLGI